MKIVKSKNLLVASILSMFLVQIIKSSTKPTFNNYQINPFVTLDTYDKLNTADKAKVTFFSAFNAALAISSLNTSTNDRTVSLDNASSMIFFKHLSDMATLICSGTYKNISTITPLFNYPRYIYGKFSKKGSVLTFYTDKNHKEVIAIFALPNAKRGEYISTLLWHTNAYTPSNPTNAPNVGPDGYIAGSIEFISDIATTDSSITLELVNPNDQAYKILSTLAFFNFI